jgi:WXG100 family type VII secretion target
MPWETRTRKVKRSFVPDEATRLASRFKTAAEQVREISAQSVAIRDKLDDTWEGKSADTFVEDHEELLQLLASYASSLEEAANRLGTKEVTIWETVEERVWVPGPRGLPD